MRSALWTALMFGSCLDWRDAHVKNFVLFFFWLLLLISCSVLDRVWAQFQFSRHLLFLCGDNNTACERPIFRFWEQNVSGREFYGLLSSPYIFPSAGPAPRFSISLAFALNGVGEEK
jgi:hypothetical protein